MRERGVRTDSLRPQPCSTREQDLKRSGSSFRHISHTVPPIAGKVRNIGVCRMSVIPAIADVWKFVTVMNACYALEMVKAAAQVTLQNRCRLLNALTKRTSHSLELFSKDFPLVFVFSHVPLKSYISRKTGPTLKIFMD